MTTAENENFLRITYLLLKGGTFILKRVLHREVQKNGGDLDESLLKYKGKLQHELHRKQFEKVFLFGGTNIDVWDIAIYITVLTIVFRQTLTYDERRAIRYMLHLRNETYAHVPNAALSPEKYEDCKEELEAAINDLSSSFDKVVRGECASIVQECLHNPLDKNSQVEQLKQFNDDLSRLVVEKISSTENKIKNEVLSTGKRISSEIVSATNEIKKQASDMHEKVIEAIKKALDEKRSMKTVQVVDTVITLNGDEDNWVELAEEMILRVMDAAIRKTGGSKEFDSLEQAVKALLDEINSNDDTEVVRVEKGSIHLKIRCCTFEGLLNLLLYLESPRMVRRLEAIDEALTHIFTLKNPISLSVKVSSRALQDILNTPDGKPTPRMVHIPIRCSSFGGLKHVWNLFEEGKAADKINRISEQLSSCLGTKISLGASVDITTFHQALEKEDNDALQCCSDKSEATEGSSTDLEWDDDWETGEMIPSAPSKTLKKSSPLILKRTKVKQPFEQRSISEQSAIEDLNASMLDHLTELCTESDVRTPDVVLVIGNSKSGKSSFIFTLQASLTGETYQFASTSFSMDKTFQIYRYDHLGIRQSDLLLNHSENMPALQNIRPHLPHVVECTGLETLDTSTQQKVLDLLLAGHIPPASEKGTSGSRLFSWFRIAKDIIGVFTEMRPISRVIFVQHIIHDVNKDLLQNTVHALEKRKRITLNKGGERGLTFVLTHCDEETSLQSLGLKSRATDVTIKDIDQTLHHLGHNPNSVSKIRWTNLNPNNSFNDPVIRYNALAFVNTLIKPSPVVISQTSRFNYLVMLCKVLFVVLATSVVIAIHVIEMPKQIVVFVDVVVILGLTLWLNRAYRRWSKKKQD